MKAELKQKLKISLIVSLIISAILTILGKIGEFAFMFGCGSFIDCTQFRFVAFFYIITFIPLFVLGSLIGWIVWKVKEK